MSSRRSDQGDARGDSSEKRYCDEKRNGRALYDPEINSVSPGKTGHFVTLFCVPRQRPGNADSKGKQQGRGCQKHVQNMSGKNGVFVWGISQGETAGNIG